MSLVGGRRVHLAEGGSGLHRNMQPIYQMVGSMRYIYVVEWMGYVGVVGWMVGWMR